MKGLKFVVLGGLIIAFSSCNKEKMCHKHSSNTEENLPQWERTNRVGQPSDDSTNSSEEIILSTGVIIESNTNSSTGNLNNNSGTEENSGSGTEEGTGEITDPNNDPDASKRKGKK
jgi:hypothetical protein